MSHVIQWPQESIEMHRPASATSLEDIWSLRQSGGQQYLVHDIGKRNRCFDDHVRRPAQHWLKRFQVDEDSSALCISLAKVVGLTLFQPRQKHFHRRNEQNHLIKVVVKAALVRRAPRKKRGCRHAGQQEVVRLWVPPTPSPPPALILKIHHRHQWPGTRGSEARQSPTTCRYRTCQ